MKKIKKILLFINFVVLILWLLSYAAGFLAPEKYWFISILGLGFFILTCIILFFILFWIFLRKWYFIPLIITGFLMKDTIRAHYNLQFSKSNSNIENKDEGALSIMSYNVKNFDLYDWNKSPNTRKDIFQMLRTERPTILCFQEYYSNFDKSKFNNEKYISDSLGYPYHFFAKFLTLKNNSSWGINIFSRLPIINAAEIPFKGKGINGAMYADIIFELDTFRVFNMHLQSIHFDDKDLETLEYSETENKEKLSGIKNILIKLKRAFIKRNFQVNTILFHLKESPYPTIVCGDFNDTPASYAYQKISNQMQDAFIAKGSGFGRTFQNSALELRIDYILMQKNFEIKSYRTIEKNFSDHKPIISTFNILK